MILRRIFSGRSRGFYVDIGAHHPRRFSNTHGFYRQGWHGINIEPNPAAIQTFRTARGRDVNLQCGVGVEAARVRYYLFDEPALNTFDAEVVASRLANTPYKLVGSMEVAVERLQDILAAHLPAEQAIDFLSIDVEGYDLQVLQSNDWQRYRPACVLVESRDTSLEEALRGNICLFMRHHSYELFAKTFNTLVFRDCAPARAV
jgi:FkbM family methyltransferase